MSCILNVIWESELEALPDEWKQRLFDQSRGNLSQCVNWRGIMLSSVSSKIPTWVILQRLKTTLGANMRKDQAGCRSSRSCLDQTATLDSTLNDKPRFILTLWTLPRHLIVLTGKGFGGFYGIIEFQPRK